MATKKSSTTKKTAPAKQTAAKKPAPTKQAAAFDEVHLSAVFAAPPARIFAAWLDAEGHSALTGGAGATVEPGVGGRHSAWDGYIQGTTLELEPPRRIVQSWRTSEFPEDAPDSRLELTLLAEGAGTRLSLHHTHIPHGQGAQYEAGWEEHYFAPMREHLR